ncbi:MAG: carbamate kinase, partial [Planctomycetota bacterium]
MSSQSLPTAVVALGGNAISVAGKEGNIEDQFEQTRRTAKSLVDAIEAGYRLVITHGNGPQVGNILRRVEIASHELYPIPLEVCVADTQAGMGYMIGQCLANEGTRRGHPLRTTTIVTSVRVDAADPAFENPTKPIGPQLSKADAETHVTRDGWQVIEVESGRYRRIVPSPRPTEILEIGTISALVERDEVVICCGGGGIPVLIEGGRYRGAAAVVDKDRTSCLLALGLKVPRLVMLTDVDHVCVDFRKPTEQPLAHVTVAEARRLVAAGHFPAGSMQPKMEAAVDFVSRSEHTAAAA